MLTDLRTTTRTLARHDTRRASLVAQRDALIVAAVAAGHSLRSVADAAGLSHVAVAKICRRH